MSYDYVAEKDGEEIVVATATLYCKPLVFTTDYYKDWEEFKEFLKDRYVDVYRTDRGNENQTEDVDKVINFIRRCNQNEDLNSQEEKTHTSGGVDFRKA